MASHLASVPSFMFLSDAGVVPAARCSPLRTSFGRCLPQIEKDMSPGGSNLRLGLGGREHAANSMPFGVWSLASGCSIDQQRPKRYRVRPSSMDATLAAIVSASIGALGAILAALISSKKRATLKDERKRGEARLVASIPQGQQTTTPSRANATAVTPAPKAKRASKGRGSVLPQFIGSADFHG